VFWPNKLMKKKLKDIADIRTGYQFRGKVAASQDANVVVIQIKDLDEKLHVQTADLVPVKVENPEEYQVSQGDVLFLSRGHRQYAAVVTDSVANTIATSYFFILHPKIKLIQPLFLAWSINQQEFQNSLRPFVRGSHMPMVSRADVANLRIDLPPLEVQQQILKLNNLLDEERRLSETIQKRRSLLVQAASRMLMTGQLTTEGNQS